MTLERELAIQSVRTSLVRRGSPRKHMLGFVIVTAGAGFVASYALLHAGVRSMALRYPVAMGIGYAVFLGLVWLWLRRHRLDAKVRVEQHRHHVDLDISQLPFDQLFSASQPTASHFQGFGGGGGFSGGGGGGGGGGFDLDLDEGALWLVPIAIIAGVYPDAASIGTVIHHLQEPPAVSRRR